MGRKLLIAAALATAASGLMASPAGAVDTLTPRNLDFGDQAVGSTSAPRTIELRISCALTQPVGPGGSPVCIGFGQADDPQVTGPFTMSADCAFPFASFAIGTTSLCNLQLRFQPTALGPQTGTFEFTRNFAIPETAELSGTGVPAPPPVVQPPAGTKKKKCKKGKKAKRKCKKKGKRS